MKSLIAGLAFLFSLNAMAEANWYHRNLRSREGVEITVDYQFAGCQTFKKDGRDVQIRLADPVWMNVKGVSEKANVTMDVEFYTKSYVYHGGPLPEPQRATDFYDRTLSLNYAGQNRFTGYANSMVTRYDIGSSNVGLDVLQKLRIKVNGQSLMDPISGSEWFQISLDDHRGCAN